VRQQTFVVLLPVVIGNAAFDVGFNVVAFQTEEGGAPGLDSIMQQRGDDFIFRRRRV